MFPAEGAHSAELRGVVKRLPVKVGFSQKIERYRIAKVVTLRYDVFFENPTPDWRLNLTGLPVTVAWIKTRLGRPLLSE